ncbi:AbiV family abortive infection protein [Paraburkholderia nodosa]|uniref:AbiV family abortive infection protein n=1 Tax=Paraburkholderia nodosa TaxID=392320 RepID=UPI000485A278|nr:AbiV family abortive infection protein [Paraburkholderia nodosa]
MGKKIDQFRWRLTLEQIAEGMNAAAKNAIRLVEDARVLLAAERYPSALALAILAIEEAGKLSILRSMVTAKDDEQLAKLWKDYRSHTKKNVAWIFMDLINRTGTTKLDDLRPLAASDAEHPYILDQLKQIAFYTDCLGKAHWSIPTNVVDRDLVGRIITIAQVLSKASTLVTPRELQLWKQHMSHVSDGSDMEASRTALSEWYAAMQAEGLRPPGPNGMQTFVTTGLDVMPDEGR